MGIGDWGLGIGDWARTLPGFDMGTPRREIAVLQQCNVPHRCCMAVVSSCREMLG